MRAEMVRARSRACAKSQAVCRPNQVSALDPDAFDSLIAMSMEIPAFPFNRSDNACPFGGSGHRLARRLQALAANDSARAR